MNDFDLSVEEINDLLVDGACNESYYERQVDTQYYKLLRSLKLGKIDEYTFIDSKIIIKSNILVGGDYTTINHKYSISAGLEYARRNKLPSDFKHFEYVDEHMGVTLAHEAASRGNLPDDFNRWDITAKHSGTVAHTYARWISENYKSNPDILEKIDNLLKNPEVLDYKAKVFGYMNRGCITVRSIISGLEKHKETKMKKFDPYRYTIMIKRVDIEEGEYFRATIVELPHMSEYGESSQEVYDLAIDSIKTLRKIALEQGHEFPEPLSEGDVK